MKKLICIAAIFLIPLLAQNKNNEIKISNKTEILKVNNERTSVAAVPRKVAYQGILTKDNGQPADDRMYSVKFRLYNLLEGGEPFWEESQIIFINDGLLSATVGVYNELNKIPANAFLEVEVGGSVLEPRQEMTSVFYSIISDTSYFAKGYTRTEDLPPVSLSGEYSDLKNIPDTLIADVFIGSASGLTGILADSVGVLSGSTPIVFDGETNDNKKISLTVEEPTSNQEIILVRQFRYGTQDYSLEPPGGVVEEGEDPLIAGIRELQEETGYVGENPELLGVVRPNAAILSNRCHIMLVRNAKKTAELNFDQHEELITELYPLTELKDLVKKGEICHSIGLNAILMLLLEMDDTEKFGGC